MITLLRIWLDGQRAGSGMAGFATLTYINEAKGPAVARSATVRSDRRQHQKELMYVKDEPKPAGHYRLHCADMAFITLAQL